MKKSILALTQVALLAAIMVTLSPRADAQISVQLRFGTRERPLVGRQFEKMRALAHYLDEASQDASSNAADRISGRSRTTRDLLASLDSFSQRAADFHERMDTYNDNPWDLPTEVMALDRSARRVNDSIRRSRRYDDVAGDWNNVLDVLNRMKQLLSGVDVQVPPAHRRGGDYDRDYAPFGEGAGHPDVGTNNGGYRNGNDIAGAAWGPNFRELLHQLDIHVTRAHELAERTSRDDDASQALFRSIHHLNDEVTALHERADAGQLQRRDLGPSIQRLLEDAQATDRRMRQANLFRDAWIEWQASINIINQMADSVR